MAELPGFLTLTALGGHDALASPISADFWGYGHVPADTARFATHGATLAGYAPMQTHLPISVASRPISGVRLACYADDYYNAIHVTPAHYDFGQISTPQTIQVSVWNAYFTPQPLADISGAEDGLTISGPDLPRALAPLEQLTWEVTVGLSGPIRLDAMLRWFFDVPSPTVTVTGDRRVVWSFPPDWSEPVTETLAWLTDVLQSESGAEQRRALRRAPRRRFSARFAAEGRARSQFDLALAFGGGESVFVLPIWPDVQLLAAPLALDATTIPCAAAGRDFMADGLAVLMPGDAEQMPFDFETVIISGVENNRINLVRPTRNPWPAGTRLYPARLSRLAAPPEMLKKTDRVLTAQADFDVIEPCDWPEIDTQTWPQMYRQRPVLPTPPNESEDLSNQYTRLTRALDNTIGPPRVMDAARRAFAVRQCRWLVQGLAAHDEFRRLLYFLRGRQRALWLPTHAADLTLAETSNGMTLRVENVGFSSFGLKQLAQRDIRINLVNGGRLDRRITGAVKLNGLVEELTLETSIPVIHTDDVARISYLTLVRPTADEVEIEHVTDRSGVARVSMTFQGVRDDEF
jgi:hypothetical protein